MFGRKKIQTQLLRRKRQRVTKFATPPVFGTNTGSGGGATQQQKQENPVKQNDSWFSPLSAFLFGYAIAPTTHHVINTAPLTSPTPTKENDMYVTHTRNKTDQDDNNVDNSRQLHDGTNHQTTYEKAEEYLENIEKDSYNTTSNYTTPSDATSNDTTSQTSDPGGRSWFSSSSVENDSSWGSSDDGGGWGGGDSSGDSGGSSD